MKTKLERANLWMGCKFRDRSITVQGKTFTGESLRLAKHEIAESVIAATGRNVAFPIMNLIWHRVIREN